MSTNKVVVGNFPIDLESVSVSTPSVFSEVAFSIAGTVDAKITSLLESGGAKQRTYAGVATTHLIAGQDADEMKMEEAKDIFEVPVVVPEWALMSLKLGKILPVDGFERHYKKLFSSIVVCTSGIGGKDLVTVWALVTYYGGDFRKNLTSKCTHLISNRCSGKAYQMAKDKGLKIVCSDWVTECIKGDSIVDESGFDPALTITTPSNATLTTTKIRQTVPPSTLVKGPAAAASASNSSAFPPPPPPVVKPATPTTIANVNQYNQYTTTSSTTTTTTSMESPVVGNSPPVVRAITPVMTFGNQVPPTTSTATDSHPHAPTNSQTISQGGGGGQTIFHRGVASPGNIHTSPQAPGNQQIMSHQGTLNAPQQQQQGPVKHSSQQQMTPQSQMGPPQSPGMVVPPNTPGGGGQASNMMQKLTIQNNPMLAPPQTSPIQGQPGGLQKLPNQLNQPPHMQNNNNNQIAHHGPPPPGTLNTNNTTSTHPSGTQVQSPQGMIHGGQMIQSQQPQNNMQQGSPGHQQLIIQGHNQGPSLQQQQQQMIQSPGPFQGQQMIQSPGQQMIQSPGKQQQPQQQMIPGQSHQQMIQSPGQQMIQSPGKQQQQMIPGQSHQQIQMIQSPGQHMITNQQGQQMMMQQRAQQPMQSPGPQQQLPLQGGGGGQGPQQQMMQTHQMQQQQQGPHQFAPQQMQYQSQGGIQPFQQKSQVPFNSQMQQQQRPHMMQNQQQQQLRFSLQQSPQPQNQQQGQQGHFQVVQQGPNRPQIVMGQMQNRGQFQTLQGQNIQTGGVPIGGGQQQQMYRQQGPQQMQMFHPIQQRLQSPPLGSQQQQQVGGGPLQQQNQLQQPHMNQQGQMMSPQQIQQQQQQQGGQQGPPQHYSVVITHQQFQQNQNPHGQQQQQQQLHPQQQQNIPSSPVQMQQQQQQQRAQFPSRPGSPAPSWTPQQQMEIIQQIQNDPQIRAQWSRMDNAQRQLLMQKLAQRKREDQLRDMLLRQQHIGQPLGSQTQPPQQQQGLQGQQTQMSQISNQGLGNSQQHNIITNPGGPQSDMMKQPLMHQTQQQQPGGIVSQVGIASPTAAPGQHSPHQGSMVQQQQILGQHPQDIIHNKQGQSPSMSHPNQLAIQNHHQQQLIASQQQKVVNSQMSPNNQQQQKQFLAPAPVHNNIRPQGHGTLIGAQQSPNNSGLVRTQQIFTPQVAQQQGSQVRIHHVLVPGQSRLNAQGMQQLSNQKMPMLQQQQIINNQWHPNNPQQRIPTPGPQSPFPRVSGTTPESPNGPSPQSWNVRPLSQSPQSPLGPGQPPVSYVQVVNSKTKTALANLLSNRLQGNAGPESNNSPTPIISSSALTTTTTTTQAMCPPPVTDQSQSLPHSSAQPTTTQSNVLAQRRTLVNLTNGCKTIQVNQRSTNDRLPGEPMQIVNSFGAAARAASSSSQPSPTLPVVPPRPQFYGHDPQLKLPPGAPLLGCVFWAADKIQETCGWKEAVLHCGGVVVNEYSAAGVTHVLSDFCRFPEFPQVVRDGKRLVSAFWLNDVIQRQVMVPPYQAFHLPAMYPRGPLPLTDHVFSTTNFPPNEKTRLIAVLIILGAKYTPYFTKFNTCLLCNKPDGIKYQKAREWKVPVVNAQFMSELFLGHVSALQMMHSPKYQCFNPDQAMRLDYVLAPHLMACWKIPIRVGPETLENYRTMKRAAAEKLDNERNAKRMKLENGSPATQSNQDIDTEPLSPITPSTEKDVPMIMDAGGDVEKEQHSNKTANGQSNQMDVDNNEQQQQQEKITTEAEKPPGEKSDDNNQSSGGDKETLNGTTSKVVETGGENKEATAETGATNLENNLAVVLPEGGGIEVVVSEGSTKEKVPTTEKLPDDSNTTADTAKPDDSSMVVERVEPLIPSIIDESSRNRPSTATGVSFPSLPPIVMVSGFTRIYKDRIKLKIEKLGGTVTTDWVHATHLILKEQYITTKLFLALCRFKHIVSAYWVFDSLIAGRFVDEKKYSVRHEKFENQFKTSIAEVLTKPSRHTLFKGVTFFMTPGEWELKRDVERIIESAGGIIDNSQKSLRHMRDYCSRFPKRSVIITSEEDFHLMEDFFMDARRPHVINIYTEDFVWNCIATQTVKLRQSTNP